MVPRAEPARQIAAGRTLCGYYFSDSGRRTVRHPCGWIERLKAAIPTQIDSTAARFSSAGEDSNAVLRHLGNLFFALCHSRGLCGGARDPILYEPANSLGFRHIGDRYGTMSGDNRRNDDERQIGVVVKTKPKTKKPSMYKVLLLNDDYTPMEFVVHVLERFFGKSRDEATQIMLHVHRRGVGICGVYTYEVAETKVTQVIDFARRHQHPLQCTMEKE
jgi:ATP-dependent Clp protease adaptor protein ClpS